VQTPSSYERCRPAHGWVGVHQPGEESRGESRARSPPSRRVGKLKHPSSVGVLPDYSGRVEHRSLDVPPGNIQRLSCTDLRAEEWHWRCDCG
jgi:hypothetical protein